MELLQDLQRTDWWIDVTVPMLEQVRKRIRLLVPLIERIKKSIVYTNFSDDIAEGTEVILPGTGNSSGDENPEFAQFEKKAKHFLSGHLGEGAIAKVHSGDPLTAQDIEELQRILVAADIGDKDTFAKASERAGSFGRFIRSLVGLDRAAAKETFAEFLDDKRYSTNQIRFVNLIIDELTVRGVVDAARVYETPYDALTPEGPEAIFVESDLDRLFGLLERFANVEAPLF